MDAIPQAVFDLLDTIQPLGPDAGHTLNLFVFSVQWSAIILGAMSGLYSARRHGMDVYGALVIGFIVSVGGGTIRDLLLGRYPIFWVANPVYVVTVLVLALAATVIWSLANRNKTVAVKVAQPVEQLAAEHSTVYIVIDSLALGLWAYLGATYALRMGASAIIAPVMGVITASFGGVLRDVFYATMPKSFLPGQLYAAAAGVGASAYALLWVLNVDDTTSFLVCFSLTFVVRVISVRYNIRSR